MTAFLLLLTLGGALYFVLDHFNNSPERQA